MEDSIRKFNIEELINYLRNEKDLKLDNEDFEVLKRKKISGFYFIEATREKFISYGMKNDSARRLANYVEHLKGPSTSTGLVSVFVDNSNLLIEGKFTVGRLEQAGTFDYQRNSFRLNQLNIDHGRLLLTVLNGRKMCSDPVIVGSRPPPSDSLWDQGYNVVVYDRNKKRKVDMALVVSAMNVIWSKDPGIFVLIAGDGDYEPMIMEALKRKWRVETWFWSSGISSDLMKKSFFYSLDNFYRHFTYAHGQYPVGKNHTLEITDSEVVEKWKDDEIMDCFVSLKLFGWWHRKERQAIYLYFNNKTNLRKAKNWIETNYPYIQVWEISEAKRKSWIDPRQS